MARKGFATQSSMLCTLHPTSLPLAPRLYVPNIGHNRPYISSMISERDEICPTVFSKVTPELASNAFNQGYIQLLTIQILEDTESCENLKLGENPIVLFPTYLSSFYNIREKDNVIIYKCQPPHLSKVALVVETSEGLDRDRILQLVSSETSRSPIPCQIHSTLLLPAPDNSEIQVCQPERPRLIRIRVESTEPFPYGYILPHTVVELEMGNVKVPQKEPLIRFIPHGSVDSSAIMLSQRDAVWFEVQEGDWVEFDVKQCEPQNLFEETEWLKIPPIDLTASPIKRTCHVVIVHEREVLCLQSALSHHIREDLDKGTIFCYVSSLILNTNSPFHPHWYAFYGEITRSKLPTILAKKISIRQVTTPHIEVTETFNDDLKQYFATPRLVRVGDLLSVPLEVTQGNDIVYTVESLEVESRELEAGDLVWATALSSTLSQVGHMSRQVSHCFSFKSFFHMPFLYGLERFFVQLLRYIYPLACLGNVKYAHFNNAIIIEGQFGSGKRTLAKWGAQLFSMNFTSIDCHELVVESPSSAEAKLVTAFSTARRCRPCVLFISSMHLLSKPGPMEQDHRILRLARYFSDLVTEYIKTVEPPLVIIGSTTSTEDLCDDIQKVFLNKISLTPLKEREVLRALKQMTARMLIAPSVDLKAIAADCHKFSLGNLQFLLNEVDLTAVGRTMELLAEQGIDFLPYHNLTTVITTEDFTSALEHLNGMRGNVVGVEKIPSVHWDDIGGMESVKKELMESLFFSRTGDLDQSLVQFKRCGLLLYGPPGCGKTMLAKAIATESKSRFINVKGPELLDKYIGQSERNIRDIFDDAIESAPCIIFFDEIDSIAPRRGQQGDSGGVIDRIAAQLLTELDRAAQTPNVYVVAATNRSDLLDPALLRPGRFDRTLEVGYVETAEDIEKVFRAVTKKFILSPDVNLEEISQRLKGKFSGSEIYGICYEAMMFGLRRKIAEYEAEGKPDAYDKITTTKEDFEDALRKTFEPPEKDAND